jgi:hypothetical protein
MTCLDNINGDSHMKNKNIHILRMLLSCLNKQAFELFIQKLYENEAPSNEQGFAPIQEEGNGLYFRTLRDSYGGSLHNVYLLHYLPLELFPNFDFDNMNDPILIQSLKIVHKFYSGKIGRWGMVDPYLEEDRKLQNLAFLTNFSGFDQEDYENKIFPQYTKLIEKVGLEFCSPLYLGSYDSFIDLSLEKTKNAFIDFVENNIDGLQISYKEEGLSINEFVLEKPLGSGVFPNFKYPLEPIYINRAKHKSEILKEFEFLIQEEVSERTLENFIAANYKDIFGNKYDRIETQLWLKFPELDIAGSKRRLDVFLRNSALNDWELYEIKKIISLTKTYRGISTISKEICGAIHQIKNYSRILSQDSVKKELAKRGIEYFEPSLNLIAGKTPQIPHAQWRWLLQSNKDVKIITYDQLLTEMKSRFELEDSKNR